MFRVLILLVTIILAPRLVYAGDDAVSWTPEGKSPDEIIAHFGLENATCLNFVDASAVEYRRERWSAAIQAMARSNREYVLNWMVGATEPPQAVLDESRRQKDCMLDAMVAEAIKPESELVLDWGDETHTKADMADFGKAMRRSKRRRRAFIQVVTRSEYRDARTQSWIWKRKFIFQSNAFNRISPEAAKKCRLAAGYTWKPHLEIHRRCWLDTLDFQAREREILVASSAPGISRHHWGTEFDLFSLNPVNFDDGKRMADEYRWLARNAVHWGFFQPYSAHRADARRGYMEERWHWSYYPVAQALLDYGAEHEAAYGDALTLQWDVFETRWNARRRRQRPFFGYVRANWRDYVFNIDRQFIRREP